MRALKLAVLAGATLATARVLTREEMKNRKALDDDLIRLVNNVHKTTWKAGYNKKFDGYTLADASRLCGSILRKDPRHNPDDELDYVSFRVTDPTELPKSFDVRDKWPQCKPTINHIGDQSDCGDCYAFGTGSAISDRWCIGTGENVILSSEDIAACYKGFNSSGCDGGSPYGVYQWFRTTGVVTGGDYKEIGTGKSCMPYQLAPCGHHTFSDPFIKPCPKEEFKTPVCNMTCDTGYPSTYPEDKRRAKKVYMVPADEESIRMEIYLHGSVTAGMTVYNDFFAYSSGVYQHVNSTDNTVAGGHSVRLIGWGEEDGTPYWLVANSWGPSWGIDNGFFKILRGTDESGIEDEVLAAQA